MPSEPSAPQRASVVVVGAGPTGLSAAYHLGSQALLVEQEPAGRRLVPVDRGQRLHVRFRRPHHVLQRSLRPRALPASAGRQRALAGPGGLDLQQGRLHPISIPGRALWLAAGGDQGMHRRRHRGALRRSIAGGLAAGQQPRRLRGSRAPRDVRAAAWRTRRAAARRRPGEVRYGGADRRAREAAPVRRGTSRSSSTRCGAPGIAKHFAIPYNEKLWAVPLEEMETSWLGGRVPLPNLEEMIEGALSPVPKPMGPNARFGYPLRGGFQALMDGFLPHLTRRACG